MYLSNVSIDPVCGRRVLVRRTTARYHLNGLDFYFCSANCLKKFAGEPLSYVFEPEECSRNEDTSSVLG